MRSLQARCEIGRVTDDGLFLRGTFSHEIADHYQAGRDADAHLEFLVARVLKAPTTPTISSPAFGFDYVSISASPGA
jgi:hypothetical protein